MTEVRTRVYDPPRSLSQRSRKIVLVAAGCALGLVLALLAALLIVAELSAGETIILIGAMGSDDMGNAAVLVALVTVAAGLCVVPVSRRGLIVLVPARAVAIVTAGAAAAVLTIGPTATATPILSGDCETGYVVREKAFLLAGWGTVYRPHGIFATAVARVSGDDGYRPFDDGAYAAVDDGRTLKVWYNVSHDRVGQLIDTSRGPALELPRVTSADGACK